MVSVSDFQKWPQIYTHTHISVIWWRLTGCLHKPYLHYHSSEYARSSSAKHRNDAPQNPEEDAVRNKVMQHNLAPHNIKVWQCGYTKKVLILLLQLTQQCHVLYPKWIVSNNRSHAARKQNNRYKNITPVNYCSQPHSPTKPTVNYILCQYNSGLYQESVPVI